VTCYSQLWDFSPNTCPGSNIGLGGCAEGWLPAQRTPQVLFANLVGFNTATPVYAEGMYHPITIVKDTWYKVTLDYKAWDAVNQIPFPNAALNLQVTTGLVPNNGPTSAPATLQNIRTLGPTGNQWIPDEFCFKADDDYTQFHVFASAATGRVDTYIDNIDIQAITHSPTVAIIEVCMNEVAILSPETTTNPNSTWDWDNGAVLNSGSWVAPVSGTYTGLRLSEHGCVLEERTTTVTIHPLPAITSGSFDGCVGVPVDIVPFVTAGAAPLTFSWDDGSVMHSTSGPLTVTPSSAGVVDYNVTVTDGNGCTAVATYQLDVKNFPDAPVLNVPSPVCAPSAGLQILNHAFGDQMTIEWGDGSPAVNTTVPLSHTHDYSPGIYNITVTATNDCGGTSTIAQVEVLEAPSISLTKSGNCKNGFTLTTTVTGNDAPYTYSWSSGDTESSVLKYVGNQSETYTVTVTGANGCTATESITINPCPCQPVIPSLDYRCEGDQIILEVLNGPDGSKMGIEELQLTIFKCAEVGQPLDQGSVLYLPMLTAQDPDIGFINGEAEYNITSWFNDLASEGCICMCMEGVFKGCDDQWYRINGYPISPSVLQTFLSPPDYSATGGVRPGPENQNLHQTPGIAICECPEAEYAGECDDIITFFWDERVWFNLKRQGDFEANAQTEQGVHIYPNPTTGLISVMLPAAAKYMTVTSILGRQMIRVDQLQSGKYDLDLSELPSGVYLVNFEIEGKTITERLVVE